LYVAKTKGIYRRIAELRERFHQLSPKKAALLQLLDEAEVAEQVFNSNAIENSTLSLEDTEKILQQIDLDRFISERELFEAKNLARVVSYMHSNAKGRELDMETVLLLHRMLLSNIRDDVAGRLRNPDEWVRVGAHIAADPAHVAGRLESMFALYHGTEAEHIVRRIARLHLEFEHIHPFVDGNGRIGRVLNNYLLIREGHVPINIKFIDRSMYYDGFREYDHNGKTTIMEEIVGKALTGSYHKRLAYLARKEIITLNQYSKRENISHSNLINKANRQTIDAFMEKGVWKIGV
jgi:Fic family protein